MKTKLLSAALIFICSTANNGLHARNNNTPPQHISYKTETNDCNVPTSQVYLDINNVRTTLLDAGDMWFNNTTSSAGYEVPKGDHTTGNSFPNAIFAGAIWISGLDAGNNLKIAAETYRTNGIDYFSGPLDNAGNTALASCNQWDQHFPVWASQINGVISAYAAQGNTGTLPLSSISDSIKFWPGKGNPYLAALGYDMSGVLAPFYDADGDGIYDPAHGDYPTIRQGGINVSAFASTCGGHLDSAAFANSSAFADQMIFWVTNDKGNVHAGTSGGAPIGVQINSLAFAFQTGDAINDMTFYRHQIINKSGAVLNRTYISQFTDVDLGCPNNDAIGCDTSRNMAFVYNGIPQNASNTPGHSYVCDQGAYCNSGTVGYGCDLPVLGIVMAETPRDTGGLGEMKGMTSFCSYTNSNAPTGDPATDVQFRNYQTGRWKDGTPITYGGNGFQNSVTSTAYMYPGDPAIATQWSECNPQIGAPIYAGDRRMLQTTGPFTFMPCASQYLSLVITFVRPVNTNCPGFSTIGPTADVAQDAFNSGFRLAGHTAVNALDADQIRIFPNPVSSDLLFEVGSGRQIDNVAVYDMTGRIVMSQSGSVKSVDMSSLADAVYIVKARAGRKESTLKVVKR
ncbi:MAG: hypothetical protein JWO03_1983 [Bacteroidetes bacterium]|nr:hypothetical protein [Bacteroidota bacterium]